MAVEFNMGRNIFPAVIWVDADKTGGRVNLIFGTRIEGQGTALQVSLTLPQWENLKFLADGPTSAEMKEAAN
jgi:hypothetical protein